MMETVITPCLSEAEWKQLKVRLRVSPRELSVTRGIFDGRKQQAIADELGISLHTVDTHWRKAKVKLKVAPHSGHAGRLEVVHRVYQLIIQIMVEEAKQAAIAAKSEAPPVPAPQTPPPPQSPVPNPQSCTLPVPVSRMLPGAKE